MPGASIQRAEDATDSVGHQIFVSEVVFFSQNQEFLSEKCIEYTVYCPAVMMIGFYRYFALYKTHNFFDNYSV